MCLLTYLFGFVSQGKSFSVLRDSKKVGTLYHILVHECNNVIYLFILEQMYSTKHALVHMLYNNMTL